MVAIIAMTMNRLQHGYPPNRWKVCLNTRVLTKKRCITYRGSHARNINCTVRIKYLWIGCFWIKRDIDTSIWSVKEDSVRFGKWSILEPDNSSQWKKCLKPCYCFYIQCHLQEKYRQHTQLKIVPLTSKASIHCQHALCFSRWRQSVSHYASDVGRRSQVPPIQDDQILVRIN